LMRRHAMQSHNLGKKTEKRKRAFAKEHEVAQSDRRSIKKLLGVK
jgi:ribosomal protein L35